MSEEEVKATVEMCQMLKAENTKLKQDKQELIEWIKGKIETKKEHMKTDISYSVFYESDIKKLQEILERLGE